MNILSHCIYPTTFLVIIITRLSAEESSWREHFEAGLLQEEIHQDLAQAIEHYQANVATFDAHRSTIALSIYRLAECYRKLGKMDRAFPLYQRVVENFSDLESLSLMAQAFVPESSLTQSTHSPGS